MQVWEELFKDFESTVAALTRVPEALIVADIGVQVCRHMVLNFDKLRYVVENPDSFFQNA